MNKERIPGTRYALLTVIKASDRTTDKEVYWDCLCRCGKLDLVTVLHADLVSGRITSCGCRSTIIGQGQVTHGLSYSRLYRIWLNMKDRCNNEKAINYRKYGGRGIKYHSDFESFVGFLASLPEGYDKGLQLDRIDNDKNYEPGNLRWSTPKANSRNKSNNTYLVDPFDNERLAMVAMAEKYSLPYQTLIDRIKYGWELKKALTTKVRSWKNKR